MKEGRPSTTAAWVAAWRAIATHAHPDLVVDRVAEQLVPPAYAAILAAARRQPEAFSAIHRMADVLTAGRSRHLALRTRAIDDATTAGVARGARQVVLVGAGLDARAFRLGSLRDAVVFEVDHPATQAYKRSRVRDLPAVAREIRFVESDFERDDLRERLARAGHDAAAPSVFVWEGVTMYLSFDAVEQVLRGVAASSAPGSTLLATYFEPVRNPFARTLGAVLRGVSEPLRATFTPAAIARRFEAHGFDVLDDAGDPEWSQRYLRIEQRWSLERLVCGLRR